MEIIAMDSHKRYSQICVQNQAGKIMAEKRIEHRKGNIAGFLERYSSGGKTRYGNLRSDVNNYLKWAFSEAGNSIAVHHKRMAGRHVSKFYKRIRGKSGHAKAVGAAGRHLAEACFWMLTKGQDYQDPSFKSVSSTAV